MRTVLSVAYPFAPVGPDAIGGAEQVLSMVDHALVAAGHRSIVVACAGSQVAGELIAVPPLPAHDLDETARAASYAAVRAAIATALPKVDLVHLHGIDFPAYLPDSGPPALVTLHLPPDWYPAQALRASRAKLWFNCVSHAQQRACPAGVSLVGPVLNGVPVEALGAARHACRGYALMLGRICPEKGQHLALDAVHDADIPLLLGGAAFPYAEHRAYLRDEVEPRLDSRRRWIGPVSFTRKRRLLAAARCLLIPSLAAETSSLVAMEAMACGTPVIATPNGALPEIVADGRTGFLAADARAMADAIRAIGTIDRALCRQEAQERFSARRMTDTYLALHAALAG